MRAIVYRRGRESHRSTCAIHLAHTDANELRLRVTMLDGSGDLGLILDKALAISLASELRHQAETLTAA